MLYREVQTKDNSALAEIIRGVFTEHQAPTQGTVYTDPTTDALYELFRAEKSILWVAEDEGAKILGCCGIFPTPGLDEDCAELVKFYLHKDARGKGVGRALMEKCVASAKNLGFKKLYLESLPEFATAVNIYEKQGFKQLDQPMGQSGHDGCNIWMLKTL
ncbi:GNAT family N-acetyltransferase [Pedobacter montanisoli]|uniref:GNAT family N-acetyltransferase n=1 Tax=Pedobacter montanisoli TaxID=2923277 RepID=A0ABS9ZZM3_9SPHI|nr:GNAT family N-acetyltransferase [Pedobacter montanisoli]MCJ0743747.1 GNAT family N-acetyltransferase [Pedobacter montanisoli]